MENPKNKTNSTTDDHVPYNPFPGLRPYTMNESHMFFGRQDQVDEIQVKLSEHRIVTVMGHSSSGKSSLLTSGLVPVLKRRELTQQGKHWLIVNIRPGASPIYNFVTSFADILIERNDISQKDKESFITDHTNRIKKNKEAFFQLINHYVKNNENFFFLIDQFEEIFRSSSIEEHDEVLCFIEIIKHIVYEIEDSIYIIIGVRSDFIGRYSTYRGLTEIINKSHYIVPPLTKTQKREIIQGPIHIVGGNITDRLVDQLLHDMGERQDQLAIVQHALMRMWDYWYKHREDEQEPIDIHHYKAIGTISNALSIHADEAYNELDNQQREIAEVLFKNVTERDQHQVEVRRPVQVQEISQLISCTDEDVIQVVDIFRKPGRSFLLPSFTMPIHSDSTIELAHESIMRIWTRLDVWVDEEYQSAKMYLRLAESSALYQTGHTNLWRPPDLQLALNWESKQKPTYQWGQRYDPAFERTLVFLETSRLTYEYELKGQERMQKQTLNRVRITNVILVFFTIIAVGFFFYGYTQQLKAESKAEEATQAKKRAIVALSNEEKQKAIANENFLKIQEQTEELEKRRLDLEYNNKRLANTLKFAEKQRQNAISNLRLASQERDRANVAREQAEFEYNRAEENFLHANSLLMLNVAQSMEIKSIVIEDIQLASLVALQGYVFHTRYGGKKTNPYVYSSLHSIVNRLYGMNYNSVFMEKNIKNEIFSIILSDKPNTFYATGSDGNIIEGDYLKNEPNKIIHANNESVYRKLALSQEEKYLIVGNDRGYLEVFDLHNEGRQLGTINAHNNVVTGILFVPNKKWEVVSSSIDGGLILTHPQNGQTKSLTQLPYHIKSIDISGDGKYLLIGSKQGKVINMQLSDMAIMEITDEKPNRVLSVAYHPNQPIVAIGIEILNELQMSVRGMVKLINLENKEVKILSGHTAGVSDLEFNADGTLLAGSDLGGKIQIWELNNESDFSIVIDQPSGAIWDMVFTPDSRQIITVGRDNKIVVYYTRTIDLAEKICSQLDRNLTLDEWNMYVGQDIPYERTCVDGMISVSGASLK